MTTRPKFLTVLVQRRLDVITTGNGAYLETFLRVAKAAGFRIRIIFAPWHAFGNRPFAALHPRFRELADEVVWAGTFQAGGRYWTVSPRIWARLGVRVFHAALNRIGVNIMWRNYFGRPMKMDEVKKLAATADRHPSDITIAEYSSVGPVLDHLTVPTRKGVLVHDVLWQRGARYREKGIAFDFYETTEAEEVRWVKSADFLVYASANEMTTFPPALTDDRKVWLRPEPPEFGPVPDNKNMRVVFLGTTHVGNVDALNHFIEDIWPLVLNRAPDARLEVAGSVGDAIKAANRTARNVTILGRIDRLEDLGGENSIGIAPTRLATGVSIKIAEYLMLGMPVVAYPLALEGFCGAFDGMLKVADDAQAFADEVAGLIETPLQRRLLSENSRQKTREILSNDEVAIYLQNQADQHKNS